MTLEHIATRTFSLSTASLALWPWQTANAVGIEAGHQYVQYSIGALLLLQTILIIVLLIQNHRRRRAERDADVLRTEITHAARLAVAGEITASIAHEVTQPLSAILSNVETAELLLRQPQPNFATISEILSDIKRDDLRANEIVRRLRHLLQKRELQMEPMDLNGLIGNVVTLIRTDTARRNIMVRTDLAANLPPVKVDPVHFQQVLLNLMLNAMNAMAATPPTARCLDIQTRRLDYSSVEVAVVDTGHGMTRDELAKAFESFFTTKEGGMGLGLSIARSIVQAHGGRIWAESNKNAGTTFRFTLPSPRENFSRPLERVVGG
jgi:signal transduction histidine kinase